MCPCVPRTWAQGLGPGPIARSPERPKTPKPLAEMYLYIYICIYTPTYGDTKPCDKKCSISIARQLKLLWIRKQDIKKQEHFEGKGFVQRLNILLGSGESLTDKISSCWVLGSLGKLKRCEIQMLAAGSPKEGRASSKASRIRNSVFFFKGNL